MTVNMARDIERIMKNFKRDGLLLQPEDDILSGMASWLYKPQKHIGCVLSLALCRNVAIYHLVCGLDQPFPFS